MRFSRRKQRRELGHSERTGVVSLGSQIEKSTAEATLFVMTLPREAFLCGDRERRSGLLKWTRFDRLTLKQLDDTAKQFQSAKGKQPCLQMASKNDLPGFFKLEFKEQGSIQEFISASHASARSGQWVTGCSVRRRP